MAELFELVQQFHPVLRVHGVDAEARRALAGLSVWQAARSAIRGDLRVAAAHLAVAREHGTGTGEMAQGFARLLAKRALWALRGPSAPESFGPDAAL